MYTIKLFCQHGASTKLLVNKCLEEAKNRGLEMTLDAYPFSEISEHIEGTDLVVLAPQVRFKLNTFQKEYPTYTFMCINPADYGMMNAKNIIDEMLKNLNK